MKLKRDRAMKQLRFGCSISLNKELLITFRALRESETLLNRELQSAFQEERRFCTVQAALRDRSQRQPGLRQMCRSACIHSLAGPCRNNQPGIPSDCRLD